jgi:hypothetical protein
MNRFRAVSRSFDGSGPSYSDQFEKKSRTYRRTDRFFMRSSCTVLEQEPDRF